MGFRVEGLGAKTGTVRVRGGCGSEGSRFTVADSGLRIEGIGELMALGSVFIIIAMIITIANDNSHNNNDT